MAGTDPATVRLGALLVEARRTLAAAGVENPGFDARLLVGGLLELEPAALISDQDRAVDDEAAERVRQAAAERAAGRPVHRILGRRDFYGLTFRLSPATLEPRPDTEALVDAVLSHLRALAGEKDAWWIADLGVGTGAIGLAILANCPSCRCIGVDRSAEAVETARGNARDLGLLDRYEVRVGDWLEGISCRFDAIVSNPPYITGKEIELLAPDVREHDPALALDGGPDGLAAYRAIAAGSQECLAQGGAVFVEIGVGQAEGVTAIFDSEGFQAACRYSDIAGIERVLRFRRS